MKDLLNSILLLKVVMTQGEQIKSKMIPGGEVHSVASERAIVEVDLIE